MTTTCAVLGLGSIGRRHAGNLMDMGVEPLCYDPDAAQCQAMKAKGARIAESREEALALADRVVIASPSQHHAGDMAAAVNQGCHVFVEKPFAHHTAGLPDVVDQAAAAGLKIFVAQNLRYHPAVNAARDLIASGGIGKVVCSRIVGASYLPDWRPTDYRLNYAADPRTGGVIFDFVHEIDMAAYLFGAITPLTAQAARTGQLDMASEDVANLVLRHADDSISNLHLSFVTRPAQRYSDITCSEGRLEIDIPARILKAWRADGELFVDHAFGGQHADDYVSELQAFMNCVDGDEEPRCPGHEALAILERIVELRHMAGLPS